MGDLPTSASAQTPDGLNDEQRQGLSQLAESLNARLFQVGADSAEQAFGLGCILLAMPVLVLIGVLFLFRVLNLILALIVLFMGAVVVTGLVTLLAHSARARAIRNAYLRDIEPEIGGYLSAHAASRAQFDQVAAQVLSEDAPLRPYLAPSLAGDIPTNEE